MVRAHESIRRGFMKKIAIAFLGMLAMVSLSVIGLADMSNTSYRITTTVMSGGGTPMG
jgi:hypothetical protein